MHNRKIYLASPLGFSPEYRSYLERIKARLTQIGYEVFDPWAQPFSKAIREASKIQDYHERLAAFTRLARDIGSVNENGVRECDILLAVLDGAEVDSGTAAEVGFAVGIGKRCYGLRTDWRDSGEFGLPLNLQVLHFLNKSGGRLFRSIEEIELWPGLETFHKTNHTIVSPVLLRRAVFQPDLALLSLKAHLLPHLNT